MERIYDNIEKIPDHVLKVIEEELTKLERLEEERFSFNLDKTHDYLDWLTMLPWGNFRLAIFNLIFFCALSH